MSDNGTYTLEQLLEMLLTIELSVTDWILYGALALIIMAFIFSLIIGLVRS